MLKLVLICYFQEVSKLLSFKEHLFEAQGHGLTMFDIDDTLFTTDNKVHVVKGGQTIRKLNAAEFNMYKRGPGEQYDYKEFADAARFQREAKPIRPLLAKLKAMAKNIKQKAGSQIIMLTARRNFDDKNIFLNTFRKFGIPIDDIRVERAGNINARSDVAKKMIVNDYLSKGIFNRVRLYDDHKQNLVSFLKLRDDYPNVDFEAYLVDKGKVRYFDA